MISGFKFGFSFLGVLFFFWIPFGSLLAFREAFLRWPWWQKPLKNHVFFSIFPINIFSFLNFMIVPLGSSWLSLAALMLQCVPT